MAMFRDYDGNILPVATGAASPIAGLNGCFIGDSNIQYSGAVIKKHFAEAFGCTLVPMGYAGATWENGEGVTHAYSAVSRVNTLIANADPDTKICNDYDRILIMMGTNCTAVGTLEDTSDNVTTMCGAVRYCLEKLLHYYRVGTDRGLTKIGVILPPQRNDGNDGQLQRNDLIQKICEEYSVATLDLNRKAQIVGNSKTGEMSYYLNDGLHLGTHGDKHLCHTVGNWVAYEL